MFGKKHKRREFKLLKRSEEPREKNTEQKQEADEEKRIRISPPDRSSYPRLMDNWMIILVFALLILFLIFILRWIGGAI